ncbi:MAG: polyprenyl synthetase family protein, partial [Actinomycetota bacterium]
REDLLKSWAMTAESDGMLALGKQAAQWVMSPRSFRRLLPAFGMVFQIVDDLLDIIATDEELGKPAGHDMEEGVYTLPVLLTLAAGGEASNELTDILGKPLSSYERDKALSIVRTSPGIASAIDSAQSYVPLCEQYCNKLPQSAATDALRAAPAVLLTSVIR